MQYRRCTIDEILAVRHGQLRPGLPLESARFEGDEAATTFHFGAFEEDGTCVGCASFMLNAWQGEPAYQLRGMATRADRAGRGIGAALLLHALAEIGREAGRRASAPLPRTVWANARSGAVGFYVKQGWQIASEEFDIPGVGPHFRITWDL